MTTEKNAARFHFRVTWAEKSYKIGYVGPDVTSLLAVKRQFRAGGGSAVHVLWKWPRIEVHLCPGREDHCEHRLEHIRQQGGDFLATRFEKKSGVQLETKKR